MSCSATCTSFFASSSSSCEESTCIAINSTCYAVANITVQPYPLCSSTCCTSTNLLRVGFVGVMAAFGLVVAAAIVAFLRRKRIDVVSPRAQRTTSNGRIWRGGHGLEPQPGDAQELDIDVDQVAEEEEEDGRGGGEFVVDHVYSRPRQSFHGSLLGDAADMDDRGISPTVGGGTAGGTELPRKRVGGGGKGAGGVTASADIETEHLDALDTQRFGALPMPPAPLGQPTPEKQPKPMTTSGLLAPPSAAADKAAVSSKKTSPMSFAIVDIDVDEVADKTLTLDEEKAVLAALAAPSPPRSVQTTPLPYMIEIEPATSPQANVDLDPAKDRGRRKASAGRRREQQGQGAGLLTAGPYKGPTQPLPPQPKMVVSTPKQTQLDNDDDIEFREEEEDEDINAQQDDDQVSLQFTVEVGATPRPQDSLAPTPRRPFTPQPENPPEISDIDTDDVVP